MKTDFEYRYSFGRKVFSKFILNFDSLHRCYLLMKRHFLYSYENNKTKLRWHKNACVQVALDLETIKGTF